MGKKIPYPVSVNEELIDWINKEIDRGEFRNRSHLVEFAIQEFKKKREEARNK